MYEKLNRIIESYRATNDTDYAIVLNGEWGCGKTYYVEHDLRKAVESSKGRILYASLHGARDYDQVVTQLMLSNLASKIGCKFDDLRDEYWLGKITRIFKDADLPYPKILGFSIKPIISKAINRLKNLSCKIDKSSTLVVIDDIERTINDETRSQILGMLYEDYIRRGYHVLLIGDETRIDKGSAYFKCKEKYVRRTINVNAWQSGLVFEFAKSKCKRLDWLYATIETQLKKFVEYKKIVNLRVVAMMIDTIVDILSSLDAKFSKDYAYFIFSATAPLVDAMSKGLIKPDDFEDFAGLTELQNVLYSYSDKDKREGLNPRLLKACNFFDEYCSHEGIDFCLIKSIFRYVLTGYLDGKSIQAEISELFHKEDSPEGAALKTLNEYWTSEEAEILESLQSVVGFLESGAYNFEQILAIYQRFYEIKNGKYVSVWPYEEDLQEMFLRFIRERSIKEDLPPHDILFRRQAFRDENNKNGIGRLYGEIDAFYDGLSKKSDADRVNKFFAALKNRDRIEADALTKRTNGQWKLFADIVEHGKVGEVVKLPVTGLRFLEYQARDNILRIINSADFERDQIPAINTIVSFLEDYVKTGRDSVSKKERISELAKVLKSAVKHMEDYLAKQVAEFQQATH